MLLFLQSFKRAFKEKIQIIIFLALVILSTLLLTSTWVVSNRLNTGYDFMGRGEFKYDYLFEYDSRKSLKESKKTITPWNTFANDFYSLVEENADGTEEVLETAPILTIGDNQALQALQADWIQFETSDGIVDSINSSNKDKLQQVIVTKPLEESVDAVDAILSKGIYNINTNSDYFKSSTMGLIYKRIKDSNLELTNPLVKNFINYFTEFHKSDIALNTNGMLVDYVKYLASSSTVTKEIFVNKVNYSEAGKQWSKKVIIGQDTNILPTSIDNFFNEGINGRLSTYIEDKTDEGAVIHKYFYAKNVYDLTSPIVPDPEDPEDPEYPEIDKILHGYNSSLDYATFSYQGFYEDYTTARNFDAKLFAESYYDAIATLTNYKLYNREQYVYFDLKKDLKYRIINYDPIYEDGHMKLIEQYSEFDFEMPGVYVVVSANHAYKNNIKLGDNLEIGENNNLYVGGIGGDSSNIYTTVENTDIFPDAKKDVLVYVPTELYSLKEGEFDYITNPNDTDDLSTTFMDYQGSNLDADTKKFQEYASSNPRSLHKKEDNFSIKSEEATALISTRYSLLGNAINIYILINVILIVFFFVVLIFTLTVLIKKIINKEKISSGILKANGYGAFHISSTYLVYAAIAILFAVPIGWLLGVAVQIPLMTIFNDYFVIPRQLDFSYQPFLISFGLMVVFMFSTILIVAMKQLNRSPLDLLSPDVPPKVSKLAQYASRAKFKKFTTRFRLILISVSAKKIAAFSFTFFIATLSLTLASIVPTALSRFSNDYYRYLEYEQDYKYNGVVGNLPLSRQQLIEWEGPNASKPGYPIQNNLLLSDYILSDYDGDDSFNWYEPKDFSYGSEDNPVAENLDFRKHDQVIKDMTTLNFTTGKGASLSINGFMEIVNTFEDEEIRKVVEGDIELLLRVLLPQVFGQGPANISQEDDFDNRLSEYINHATKDFLPAKIKQLWNTDRKQRNEFALTFGTELYNKDKENLYTRFDTKFNDLTETTGVYGISEDSFIGFKKKGEKEKIFNYNEDLDVHKDSIPLIINKAAELKHKWSVGQTLTSTAEVPLLHFATWDSSDNIVYKEVKKEWWSYKWNEDDREKLGLDDVNSKQETDPFKIDLSKLTGMPINKNKTLGYYDKETKQAEPYYSLKNLVLTIPKEEFSGSIPKQFLTPLTGTTAAQRKIPGLLDANPTGEYNEEQLNIVNDDGGNFIIKPFSTDYDSPLTSWGSMVTGYPTDWYNLAYENNFLKIQDVKKPLNYKVVGIQDSYDVPKTFIDQKLANDILEYNNDLSAYPISGDNPNLWYNGKFSKYEDPVDQTTRYNIIQNNGSNSFLAFTNGDTTSGVGATDYLSIKRSVINQLAIVTINLTIVFVSITIAASVIIIYIMTESFVNGFLKFIAVMKSMGYSNREVNSLTLGIFTPFVFITWGLTLLATWWATKGSVLLVAKSAGYALPILFPWALIPITLGVITIIYFSTFFISYNKIKKMSIQEQVNAQEV